MASISSLATAFRSLHKPGAPLLLTNVYDAVTARSVASLSRTTALATASYAVAAAAGLDDDDLTLEANLAAVKGISKVARQFNLPLTVDFQDGYGDQLEEGVGKLLDLGVVGVNLEDAQRGAGLMDPSVATERVKRVLKVAHDRGVADFVVNARTDALVQGGTVDEAIERGKRYLQAGATTVFVWGGSSRGGITRDEVAQLTKAFGGKLNVSLKVAEGILTVKELSKIGVARISIGPALQFVVAKSFAQEADKLLESGL